MSKQDRHTILIFLGITLLVYAVIVISALDRHSSGNNKLRGTPSPVESELSKLIVRYKNGELDSIDMSAATTFSWDKLYIFSPYTSPREIDSAVGISWRKNCYTWIQSSDGVTLLVFANDNVVVHCLDYPKNEGDFLIQEREYKVYREGLSPQESRFNMNEHGDLIWISNK